ncbi:MAG: sodium/solute symporter [Verrucomicrobia bacterium]|nr:sodium/solute symporter [Verrucomicrobiota bacterium]
MFPAAFSHADEERAAHMFSLQAIPTPEAPTHGAFVGTVSGQLVFAGGYHSIPRDGNWTTGEFSPLIQYFDPLPTLSTQERGWSKIRQSLGLKEPKRDDQRAWNTSRQTLSTAFGASANHGNFLYGAGGITEYGLTDVVFRLMWTEDGWQKQVLPPLPQPVALSGAAVMGNRLYVVGGISDLENPEPLNTMWVLNLQGDLNPADPELWQTMELPHYTGTIRPTVTVRRDEVAIADALFVLGGFTADPLTGNLVPQRQNFKYLPPEQSMAGWFELRQSPEGVLLKAALPVGPAHVMLTGRSVTEAELSLNEVLQPHGDDTDAWIGTYHIFTNQWVQLPWPGLGLLEPFAVNTGSNLVFIGIDPHTETTSLLEGALVFREKHFSNWDYLAMVIYLIALVAIGKYFARRDKGTDYFFLGGRKIPWWAAGLSIYATGTSAISFMAIPAKTYMTDWLYFIGMSIFPFFTLLLAAYLIIPLLRRLEITTVMEYFDMRFGLPIRFIMSFVSVMGQVAGRMSITLLLPALALTAVTGMDIYMCILLMGVLATIYTVMGGISAVIWTDVLQVAVLFGGAILSFILIIGNVDGGLAQVVSLGVQDNKFNFFDFRPDLTTATMWIMLLWAVSDVFAKGLGQEGLQRAFSTPDVKSARRSMITCAVVALPAGFLFYGIGTALYAFYSQHPELLNPTLQNDAIFPLFIAQQLPIGLAGLVISALFAAAMSTLDTAMNSVSAIVTRDYYGVFRKNVPEAAQMRLARWITIACGVIGTGIALYMASFENLGSLWDRFSILLALIGGGLGGVGALALLTTRANTYGTLLGIIFTSGFIYWLRFFAPAIPGISPLHFFAYGTASLVVGFVTGYLFSLLISFLFPKMAQKDLKGLTLWTA